jgi:hypothetical protein
MRLDAETLAEQALERFHDQQLYADRKLIRQGLHLAAARQIARRIRRRFWFSLLGCSLMAWLGGRDLFGANSHRDALHAWNGGLLVAVALLGVMAKIWRVARAQEMLQHVEQLLPEQAEVAEAPVAC